ncbi:hypothetical protein [Streptomyces sp. ISL-86]|uniref:hypothetical protein n=1 Tax=Streptomyces sp. ISL-86 TaxID=2819187 RepID=UPI001BE7F476|nr:hypothetical protein [Streptomyces sp. ISL-86]MBT2453281.1 hypothetical protein [Streptomyces sp. ISL-86]
MSETATAKFTTADIEGLADVLAIAKEELGLYEIHPRATAYYLALAADLASGNTPRTMEAIAEFITLAVEDAGHLDQVAPWVHLRYVDTADAILKQF